MGFGDPKLSIQNIVGRIENGVHALIRTQIKSFFKLYDTDSSLTCKWSYSYFNRILTLLNYSGIKLAAGCDQSITQNWSSVLSRSSICSGLISITIRRELIIHTHMHACRHAWVDACRWSMMVACTFLWHSSVTRVNPVLKFNAWKNKTIHACVLPEAIHEFNIRQSCHASFYEINAIIR